MYFWKILVISAVAEILLSEDHGAKATVGYMLNTFDEEYAYMSWLQQNGDFTYSTNQTEHTADQKSLTDQKFSKWMRRWKIWARNLDVSSFSDDIRRAVSLISNGVVFFDSADTMLASKLRSQMVSIYSSTKISLAQSKKEMTGEDEIGKMMSSTRDPEILADLWTSWRKEVGEKIKPLFLQLVQIMNKASRDNEYSDIGESWRQETGVVDVVSTVLQLWKGLEGFYKELHAYIRRKLFLYYGDTVVDKDGPLPVHLLGSVWGDNWQPLYDIAIPYPERPPPNITSEMIFKNFTIQSMFELAERFYTSVGLEPMTSSFWKKSMFTRPRDGRLVDCHAAAYDFSIGTDYRIRICSEVTEVDLMRAVHEMGHVEYYMAYRIQPMVFRGGANSAFHEAVGETMVYSSYNPRCLQKLGLADNISLSPELSVNLLMKQALSKIVSLPWALGIDLWRYLVFNGDVTPQEMTRKWWFLRNQFQGVKAPNEKAAELFDPGSKYHITNSMPYIRYYLSRFLEHQFHESLCNIAGRQPDEPLHFCCFLGSEKAGEHFRTMMSMGASQRWPDTLEMLTGRRHLSAKSILNYYQPLYEWLREYNRINDVPVGW